MPESDTSGNGGPGRRDDELAQLHARIASLEAAQRTAKPRRHRGRSFLAALLIVLGCVLAPLSAVASWASDVVGDTDTYVDTVAPLASDPDIQNAVANRVTDAVMERLDLQTLLQDVAPKDRPLLEKALGKLGDSLEDAVRSFVHDKAQDVAASDTFERIWTQANRRVHSAVDKALTGSGGGAVKINDDTVTLDLGPVVEDVKQRLVDEGLTAAGKIPEVSTDFTLVKSEDVGKVKTYFRILQLMGNWLPVIAVLLVAVGVWLSAHRRRVLVAAALGFAFATAVLGVALTVFRAVYLDALPPGVSQGAAGAVYDTLIHYLRTAIRTVVTLGVVVALAAWLTGPGRWATALRTLWGAGIGATRAAADRLGMRTGPVGPFIRRHRRWFTWILVLGAVLAYVFWSRPTGWVVVGLALALLFAFAVVGFLAADGDAGGDADRDDDRDSGGGDGGGKGPEGGRPVKGTEVGAGG
ncbi:hypothetical protein [Streptomyces fructofermentans]|uniref:Integral membrane protein n=1 Tax=Streptomyces fructofermentans TaxID=152141 RepID=A0A918NPG5_9ACTN|nr:hypothetical protein [Streptomyces fructofermentans]GGX84807.1 hypothetical protein GCM10010515_60280 [Streptomyces fructofermentans]